MKHVSVELPESQFQRLHYQSDVFVETKTDGSLKMLITLNPEEKILELVILSVLEAISNVNSWISLTDRC